MEPLSFRFIVVNQEVMNGRVCTVRVSKLIEVINWGNYTIAVC